MPKKHQYKIINTGNTSQSIKTRQNIIIKQIPIGKAIVFHNTNQILEGKTLVNIVDHEDIPPIRRPRNRTKAILKKAGFKHITETDKAKPKRKKHK
jgi:hypothetical protein